MQHYYFIYKHFKFWVLAMFRVNQTLHLRGDCVLLGRSESSKPEVLKLGGVTPRWGAKAVEVGREKV